MTVNTVLETLQQNTRAAVVPAEESQQLNKDEFLRLFITQLEFQDPLNPMDNTETLSELAQFTALEQQTHANELLESVIGELRSLSQFDLVQFIGRQVVAEGNTVSLPDRGDTSLAYDLGENANQAVVSVFDQSGALVRSFDLGAQAQGRHVVTWDGLDANGNRVPEGTYVFAVQAVNAQRSPISVQTFLREDVVSTTWVNGESELILKSGRSLKLNEILAAA